MVAWDRNRELWRSSFRLLGRSQVGDGSSHDVGRHGLRRRVTIRLHADWDYADNGDKTKGGDTNSKRYLNQRKPCNGMQGRFTFGRF